MGSQDSGEGRIPAGDAPSVSAQAAGLRHRTPGVADRNGVHQDRVSGPATRPLRPRTVAHESLRPGGQEADRVHQDEAPGTPGEGPSSCRGGPHRDPLPSDRPASGTDVLLLDLGAQDGAPHRHPRTDPRIGGGDPPGKEDGPGRRGREHDPGLRGRDVRAHPERKGDLDLDQSDPEAGPDPVGNQDAADRDAEGHRAWADGPHPPSRIASLHPA